MVRRVSTLINSIILPSLSTLVVCRQLSLEGLLGATPFYSRLSFLLEMGIRLPEDMGTYVLEGIQSSANFRGQNIGDALRGTLTPVAGNPVEVLLPLRFPSFDKMRQGEQIISVAELKQRFYTGLQVISDPGVGLVYLGFILMILGCYVTFFMSHQQICVEAMK